MNPLNNCYESINCGPALVRRAGDHTVLVCRIGDCWGYLILDTAGTVIASSWRFTLDATGACEEADGRLAELAGLAEADS